MPMTMFGGDTDVSDTYPVLGRSRMCTKASRVTPYRATHAMRLQPTILAPSRSRSGSMAMTRLSSAIQKTPPSTFSVRIVPNVVPDSAAASDTGSRASQDPMLRASSMNVVRAARRPDSSRSNDRLRARPPTSP